MVPVQAPAVVHIGVAPRVPGKQQTSVARGQVVCPHAIVPCPPLVDDPDDPDEDPLDELPLVEPLVDDVEDVEPLVEDPLEEDGSAPDEVCDDEELPPEDTPEELVIEPGGTSVQVPSEPQERPSGQGLDAEHGATQKPLNVPTDAFGLDDAQVALGSEQPVSHDMPLSRSSHEAGLT